MKRRRKLMHVGSLGDDLVRRLDPRGVRHTSRVVAAWPQVAGPEVDAHTKGFSLRDGQLLVYVDSPMWANELSIMSEEYRTRLNQEAGEEAVRKIRFIVSNKAQRTEERAPGPAEEPPADAVPDTAISPSDRDRIERVAGEIGDDDLRRAAMAAMGRRTDEEDGPEPADGKEPEKGPPAPPKNTP